MLLIEKALTIRDEQEQNMLILEETLRQVDSMVETKKRTTSEERLDQLKQWVQSQREKHNVKDGAPFRCPKPKNGNKGDIESHLGSWINSKVYEASSKKMNAEVRMKAIEVLNGPIAETLGREENWWYVSERTFSALKKRPVTNEENITDNRPKRKRPSKSRSATEEQVNAGSVTTWVRSSRARPPKPNMKFSSGCVVLGSHQ